MLNKLKAFMGSYSGEKVVCAVSGGADSMALLWGLYLLKDTLALDLSAAHFNHRLRGEESDRDEAFVREFCGSYGIPFVAANARVTAGKKGLEAAARDARYGFLKTLSGKIATAHTADDNAETILMHLVRGTGLKGLGGIAPVNGNLIRPMLQITRDEVLAFLQSYHIPYVEDSSNAGDAFLRNRLRHHVMPLLKEENPSLAKNLSAMALRLRQDEAALDAVAKERKTNCVSVLRTLDAGIRSRILAQILLDAGVREPEAEHILAMEKLVFSEKPSAKAYFSDGIIIKRNYDILEIGNGEETLETRELINSGVTDVPELGLQIVCLPNTSDEKNIHSFPIVPNGKMVIRPRMEGDTIRLSGGTKTLKKLFVDMKIPASKRNAIPVLADDDGVLGVVGIGGNLNRISFGPDAIRICVEYQ